MFNILCLILCMSAFALILSSFAPIRDIQINMNDPSIGKPLKSDTIPFILITVLAILLPFLLIIFTHHKVRPGEGITKKENINNNKKLFILTAIVNILFTISICESIKIVVQKPRPDYLARMEKIEEKNKFEGKNNFIDNHIKINIKKEAQKSFPSGHTAATTSTATYMGYYLYKIRSNYFVTLFYCMLSLLASVSVAYTRILDNKHFLLDVIGGFLIGFYSSIFICFIANKSYKPVYEDEGFRENPLHSRSREDILMEK